MPFGLKNAPVVFQKIIEDICRNVGGSRNLIDDIIIGGRALEELVERTKSILQLLKEIGLKVNRRNVEIGVKKINLFGFYDRRRLHEYI